VSIPTIEELYNSLQTQIGNIKNEKERLSLLFFFSTAPHPNDKQWVWRKSSSHYRINGYAKNIFKDRTLVSFDISGSVEKPKLVVTIQHPHKRIDHTLAFDGESLIHKEITRVYDSKKEKNVFKKYKDGKCSHIREIIRCDLDVIRRTELVCSEDRFVAVQTEYHPDGEKVKKLYSGRLKDNQVVSLKYLKNPKMEEKKQK
jgi:hypothetical protein